MATLVYHPDCKARGGWHVSKAPGHSEVVMDFDSHSSNCKRGDITAWRPTKFTILSLLLPDLALHHRYISFLYILLSPTSDVNLITTQSKWGSCSRAFFGVCKPISQTMGITRCPYPISRPILKIPLFGQIRIYALADDDYSTGNAQQILVMRDRTNDNCKNRLSMWW